MLWLVQAAPVWQFMPAAVHGAAAPLIGLHGRVESLPPVGASPHLAQVHLDGLMELNSEVAKCVQSQAYLLGTCVSLHAQKPATRVC